MFEAAEAYERDMGRWSGQLAPMFIDFIGVDNGDSVLDVGCGTGSFRPWPSLERLKQGRSSASTRPTAL